MYNHKHLQKQEQKQKHQTMFDVNEKIDAVFLIYKYINSYHYLSDELMNDSDIIRFFYLIHQKEMKFMNNNRHELTHRKTINNNSIGIINTKTLKEFPKKTKYNIELAKHILLEKDNHEYFKYLPSPLKQRDDFLFPLLLKCPQLFYCLDKKCPKQKNSIKI